MYFERFIKSLCIFISTLFSIFFQDLVIFLKSLAFRYKYLSLFYASHCAERKQAVVNSDLMATLQWLLQLPAPLCARPFPPSNPLVSVGLLRAEQKWLRAVFAAPEIHPDGSCRLHAALMLGCKEARMLLRDAVLVVGF